MLEKILQLTNAELDDIDMMPIYEQFPAIPEREYLLNKSGIDHYRLLVWLSLQAERNGTSSSIIELGTYQGLSAACLAVNPSIYLSSFDTDFRYLQWKAPLSSSKNIRFLLVNDEDALPDAAFLLYADIIFCDTWHNGKMEKELFEVLKKWNWVGLLIYDDIYYNNAMKEFWNSIDHPRKADISHLGHITGTGIIDFSYDIN